MSQADILLERLKLGETITPFSALQIAGSLACHSVMAELRGRGYNIVCTLRTKGRSRWGEYRLIETQAAPVPRARSGDNAPPEVDTLTRDMFI